MHELEDKLIQWLREVEKLMALKRYVGMARLNALTSTQRMGTDYRAMISISRCLGSSSLW
jgi:hypothetical protein